MVSRKWTWGSLDKHSVNRALCPPLQDDHCLLVEFHTKDEHTRQSSSTLQFVSLQHVWGTWDVSVRLILYISDFLQGGTGIAHPWKLEKCSVSHVLVAHNRLCGSCLCSSWRPECTETPTSSEIHPVDSYSLGCSYTRAQVLSLVHWWDLSIFLWLK